MNTKIELNTSFDLMNPVQDNVVIKNEDAFINECKKIANVKEFIRDIKLRKIVRAMMNAKPDLAVIYYDKEKGARKLLFIECKYESDEDNYMFYNYRCIYFNGCR